MWHFGLKGKLRFSTFTPPQKNSKPRKRLWAKSWSKHFSPKSAKILCQSGRRKKKRVFCQKIEWKVYSELLLKLKKKKKLWKKQKTFEPRRNFGEISVSVKNDRDAEKKFRFRFFLFRKQKKTISPRFWGCQFGPRAWQSNPNWQMYRGCCKLHCISPKYWLTRSYISMHRHWKCIRSNCIVKHFIRWYAVAV